MKTVHALNAKSLKSFFRTPKRWCKRQSVNNTATACCLYGAGARFSKEPDWIARLTAAIKKLYPERAGSNITVITSFNDHEATTFADIQRIVREANV